MPIVSRSMFARTSPFRLISRRVWLKSVMVNTLPRTSCPRSPSIRRMFHFAWENSLHATCGSANLSVISLGQPFSPCMSSASGRNFATIFFCSITFGYVSSGA